MYSPNNPLRPKTIPVLCATSRAHHSLSAIAVSLFLSLGFLFVLTTRAAPAAKGQMAYATVFVGEQTHKDMRPNQESCFTRIYNIPASATVGIAINYPNGSKGERVVVGVGDGGVLGNGKGVEVIPLDSGRNIRFNFQVAESSGLYRVTLRKGSDEKTVELWVGARPQSLRNNPEL
jgi:hypothetical protein